MKWRYALVYLAVLLLAAGYYSYFEVFQKNRQEMAASEARKVFRFDVDRVNILTVNSKENEAVQLKKEGQWEIVEPVKAEADRFSVDDLLHTLSRLETEREVLANPHNLQPFGLLEPDLRIGFLAGEQKFELLMGGKNPVGDAFYAKTGDQPQVFLIAQGNQAALNKGLNELRRRQLFSFQLDDVAAVQVAWRDGTTVAADRTSDGKAWKAPANPQAALKKSKIDNLIEQIHWLRAQNFLENAPSNLSVHGLEPPLAMVSMGLKSGENVTLQLAGKEANDQKQVAALSSQLPSVVQVAAGILDDLPKDLQALEDRSLLGFKADEIKRIKWTLGDAEGHAVQLDKSQWGLKKGDQEPQALTESWHVSSLLWDLGDSEYQRKLDPAPPASPKPYCRIDLGNGEKNLLTLSWGKPPREGRELITVRVEREGETVAVSVDAEALRRIVGDLERLNN
jgi:hypothetical protein